jgi:hypothetical protein
MSNSGTTARPAGENRTVLRSDADLNAAAESADQVGWSRLNIKKHSDLLLKLLKMSYGLDVDAGSAAMKAKV